MKAYIIATVVTLAVVLLGSSLAGILIPNLIASCAVSSIWSGLSVLLFWPIVDRCNGYKEHKQ